MANAVDVPWELWVVNDEVIGARTVEEKPKFLFVNHGEKLIRYVVRMHNARVDPLSVVDDLPKLSTGKLAWGVRDYVQDWESILGEGG